MTFDPVIEKLKSRLQSLFPVLGDGASGSMPKTLNL